MGFTMVLLLTHVEAPCCLVYYTDAGLLARV